jgi:hypothetical protein
VKAVTRKTVARKTATRKAFDVAMALTGWRGESHVEEADGGRVGSGINLQ